MKFTKLWFLLVLVFSVQSAMAGHGRDGGWPQSIQLLRLAKKNLLELVNQVSDQEVQDAIDGMHDRDEAIKPGEVNKAVLKTLIESIVEPDVEQIEKDKYDGVRLFYYDDSNIPNYKIFATKNYFNNSKYQLESGFITMKAVKEVQTLLLHEISHLWGFGEENGDINYARTFAVNMIEILHGNFKKSYSLKEKMTYLGSSFEKDTHSIAFNGEISKIEDKTLHCLVISDKGETHQKRTFLKSDLIWSDMDGSSLRTDEAALIRATTDDYVLIETIGRSPLAIPSKFKGSGIYQKYVNSYSICHKKEEMLKNYMDRFVTPFFSRSNLMTDMDFNSVSMFQYIFTGKLQTASEYLKEVNKAQTVNQNQIIYNVDFKIKTQMKKDYEWLIDRSYKYTKEKDSAVINRFNQVVGSDMSPNVQVFHSMATNTLKSTFDELNRMQNISRKMTAGKVLQDFTKEFNAIVETANKFEKDRQFTNACGGEKKIGKYYECILENNKNTARERIQLYKRMDIAVDALLKKYQSRVKQIN